MYSYFSLPNDGFTFHVKHAFLIGDDNETIREDDFYFTDPTDKTMQVGIQTKTLGTDYFWTKAEAEKEVLKRRGPKFAAGSWVHCASVEQTFQVKGSRQGFITGNWYYQSPDSSSDYPYPESSLEAIPAPEFAVGDWVRWLGFGGFPTLPSIISERTFQGGRWEYTTDKLLSHYPVGSFERIPAPTYEVGSVVSCCGGTAERVTKRTYDGGAKEWRYKLDSDREASDPFHGDYCLNAAELPPEKPALKLTPRFQVGQRVEWKYSWMSEAKHGVVTLVEVDEDGDLRYGVTPDGEDFTDEDERHDFYDQEDGKLAEDLKAETVEEMRDILSY